MADSNSIVIDTNVLFSALLRENTKFAQIILESEHKFYICESTIVEMFKHKERIIQISRLSDDEVIKLFYILLRRVTVSKEELIEPSIRKKAFELCKNQDEADTPQVALTMHLKGLLWTGDQALKDALQKSDFNAFFTPDQI